MLILLDDAIRIPRLVGSEFDAFRRWIRSSEYPERGTIEFLGEDVWIDLAFESRGHNQIRLQLNSVVALEVENSGPRGKWFGHGMRLVNETTRVSAEPDAMFASHQSVSAGRVRWEQGRDSLEVIGTPDMVLEVVSTSSVQKDTIVLRELYAAAGIAEYWLVNPLRGQLSFDILRLSGRRYRATRKSAGWIKSSVFGKSFRLIAEESTDDLPHYRLLVR